MELKEILKSIDDVKVIAQMTPEQNPRNYNVQLGKIRRAQEDLNALLEGYRNAVRQKAVFILPTGAGAEKFTQMASEGCFSSNVDDLFVKVTEMLSPVLYENQPFNASTLDTAMSYFSEVMDTIGVTSYPQVVFKSKYIKTLRNKQDMVDSLREAVIEQVGPEIIGYFTIHTIAQQAVNEKFAGKAVPIVLHSNDLSAIEKLSEDLKIVTRNVFLIDSKEDVSEKDVEATLKKIKKAVV